MPQIRLERVSKYYPQDKKQMAAVQEINLTVEQGEFLFLTGSSGAGKSTLLQLISGDLRPTSGAVLLDDINLTRRSRLRRDRLRLVFGRVPQLSQLMRKRTISENLSAVAMLTQSRKLPPIQTRIQKTLAMVGLPDVGARYPVELSYGECRRVELARAIINSPSILVLDELTANLDEDTIWDILHLLCEINRHGTTIIMATHAKEFVNLLRKRVITLVDGQIWGDVQKGRYGDIV